MTEGVATFSGLFLDRAGRNVKLRFSLYDFDRATGDWIETGVHLDTDFFHVGEGTPTALHLEQVNIFDTTTMYPSIAIRPLASGFSNSYARSRCWFLLPQGDSVALVDWAARFLSALFRKPLPQF